MKLYKNRDWLFDMYVEKDLSQGSIAKLCEVHQSTIHKYLVRFDIPTKKFCGRSGEKCHLWKGGKIHTSQGYIHILRKKHPLSNSKNYVPEQVLIVEKHLNRYLTKKERVHHINGIKDDNRIENLYLFPSINEHQSYHQKFRRGTTVPITKSNLF